MSLVRFNSAPMKCIFSYCDDLANSGSTGDDGRHRYGRDKVSLMMAPLALDLVIDFAAAAACY